MPANKSGKKDQGRQTYEVGGVHDAILNGVSAIDGELQVQLLALDALSLDRLHSFQLLRSLLLSLNCGFQGSSLLVGRLLGRSVSLLGTIGSRLLLGGLVSCRLLLSGLEKKNRTKDSIEKELQKRL